LFGIVGSSETKKEQTELSKKEQTELSKKLKRKFLILGTA
jgi:hypothetical protein